MGPFVPEELPPLVTFADDDVDDAISSNSDECLSIEELESAVFSENEEEEIQNVKIIEPLTDDYDNIDISAQEKLSSKKERVIPITLDDGKVMTPLFTKLDELKPPNRSIFHKEGNGKPDSFCSPCT